MYKNRFVKEWFNSSVSMERCDADVFGDTAKLSHQNHSLIVKDV